MNRIAGVVKIHLQDKSLIYMPWLIVSISFVANLTIGLLISDREPMYTGGIASLYVFMLVFGLIVLPQTFPFALGMSVRRTDYFWGTAAVIAAASAVFSVLLLLLAVVESEWTAGWGVDLHFFKLPYLNDGPALAQLWIFFSCLLNMFYLGFAISSIHRRFGKKGMWIATAVSFVIFTVVSYVCTYNEWWGDIYLWIAAHTMFQLSLYMFAGAVVYALASYALLRRASA
ncbi:hypothetical protein [Paenibacillus sp. GYB003]|uniref:hypothetical protein n=1 Tax=Paenibacillus sp. GYB003 TaxID=2994392 RepID=UPI002F9644FE